LSHHVQDNNPGKQTKQTNKQTNKQTTTKHHKQTNKQQQNTKTKNKIKQNKTNFKVKNQHFPDGRLNCLSLTELSESECYK
jgi:hypothetical protein